MVSHSPNYIIWAKEIGKSVIRCIWPTYILTLGGLRWSSLIRSRQLSPVSQKKGGDFLFFFWIHFQHHFCWSWQRVERRDLACTIFFFCLSCLLNWLLKYKEKSNGIKNEKNLCFGICDTWAHSRPEVQCKDFSFLDWEVVVCVEVLVLTWPPTWL